jgi:hypothetical protein
LSRILACGTQSQKREVEKRRQSNMWNYKLELLNFSYQIMRGVNVNVALGMRTSKVDISPVHFDL